MKTIFQAQNEEMHINQLAAQRQLYFEGKRLQWYLFVIVVPITILIFVLGNLFQSFQTFTAFWGGIITLIEIAVLNVESNFRIKASKIQELFDCEVLQLPWNKVKCQTKPDLEDIIHYSKKHLSEPGNREKLINWYFEKSDCLSLPYSRLICQRANLSWDSKLRRRFGRIILLILSGLFFIMTIIAFSVNLTVNTFFLFWLLPILPVYVWGCIQCFSQFQAANELDKLKQILDEIWDDIFQKNANNEDICKISRDIQDEIFSTRKNTIAIPDVIYNKFRDNDQSWMYKTSDQLCIEALKVIKKII